MVFRKLFPEIYDSTNPLVFMGRAKQSALSESITLLVWNVYKTRKSGWYSDFLNLVNKTDLVLLQESVLNNLDNSKFEKTDRFEWIMACSHKYRLSQVITGLKTGCVAQSNAQILLHSPDKEPILNTSKLMLATRYPLESSLKQLLVLNVHAINFVTLKKYASHINQILSVIHHHTGPIILAGDFNCWNDARIKLLFERIKNAGLTTVTLDRKTRWHQLNHHLDYIFYRDLQLKNAQTLSSIHSSDHFPIMAEFVVNNS
ncbi:MAG: endonuclease/exonuclease/phosphatase family protein [Methylococcaceae bacterium]|jgi:endonuclease/exonuclease/phosphatase (EEP) superfamily protein YafD